MDSSPRGRSTRRRAATSKSPCCDFFNVGRNLFIEEFAGGAGDGVMLFGEIFGSENRAWSLIFYEEGTAGGWHMFQIRSKIPAAPWPPPTHMVTMP